MGRLVPYTFTVAESAARTASFTGPVINNADGFEGVRIWFNSSASSATPSVTCSIQHQDPVSGDWVSILTSAAVTDGTGNLHLTVGPGVATVSNVSLGTYIGRKLRVITTASDSDSLTYSIVGEWLGAC